MMKAYITILSNSNYYEGVLALNESLIQANARYPLYCVLSQSVDEEVKQGLRQKDIPYIQLEQATIKDTGNLNSEYFSYWNYTFDKLQIWGLEQFDKLVYLDADMIVLNNIDHLFNCPNFSAVCAGKSFPGNDSWIELNAGLMIVEPNGKIAEELINLTPDVVKEYLEAGKPVGDQDVINRYLGDWFSCKELVLDEGYNILAPYLSYYTDKLNYSFEPDEKTNKIYVVHFTGNYKPWMVRTLNDYLHIAKRIWINPRLFAVLWRYKKLLSVIRK